MECVEHGNFVEPEMVVVPMHLGAGEIGWFGSWDLGEGFGKPGKASKNGWKDGFQW